jgi:hypothetical protein
VKLTTKGFEPEVAPEPMATWFPPVLSSKIATVTVLPDLNPVQLYVAVRVHPDPELNTMLDELGPASAVEGIATAPAIAARVTATKRNLLRMRIPSSLFWKRKFVPGF